MCDFSPNSAVDVVETKSGIEDIVPSQKGIRTDLWSELFTTIVCYSQHVDILTNSVSARHRRNLQFSDFSPSSAVDVVETKKGIGDIVSSQKGIRTGLSSRLSSTIVCCSQHVEILTNSVSARHRAKCAIFRQVRRSTSSKRKAVSKILFHRRRVSGLVFRADYLPRLSAVHNTSKY